MSLTQNNRTKYFQQSQHVYHRNIGTTHMAWILEHPQNITQLKIGITTKSQINTKNITALIY